MHTYIHTYIHTYMHTYIRTYVHTYIQTDRQTDTYTHTHTHRQTATGRLRQTDSVGQTETDGQTRTDRLRHTDNRQTDKQPGRQADREISQKIVFGVCPRENWFRGEKPTFASQRLALDRKNQLFPIQSPSQKYLGKHCSQRPKR